MAVVEVAVLLPFLMFLCLMTIDWARMLYFTQCVTDFAAAVPSGRRTSKSDNNRATPA